jgi:AcrR family transcriptional regulator
MTAAQPDVELARLSTSEAGQVNGRDTVIGTHTPARTRPTRVLSTVVVVSLCSPRPSTRSRATATLLFGSKQELFTAAVTQALDQSLTAATGVLADTARPLRDRLLSAFDHWTGRYIGAMSREVNSMAEEYQDLLGSVVAEYPRRFAALLDAALAESPDTAKAARSAAVTQTLISTSTGIKHEVTTREAFLERLATAIDLIVS